MTNDETKEFASLSVAELTRTIGLEPLPGLPQKVREAGMKLPKPIGRGGSSKRKAGRESKDEFSLKEFVRGVLERFGGNR